MSYNLLHLIPYIYVLITALCGMDVFVVLFSGTFIAGIVGIVTGSMTIAGFVQAIGTRYGRYDVYRYRCYSPPGSHWHHQ